MLAVQELSPSNYKDNVESCANAPVMLVHFKERGSLSVKSASVTGLGPILGAACKALSTIQCQLQDLTSI